MIEYQDAFISYGRADSKALASKLYDRLSQEGLKVWFDFADIPLGVDYQKQIDDGIETTHNFLFIISPHSIHSPYCRLEIDLALQYNKRIIPLLHVEEINQETWQQRNPQGTESAWQHFVAEGKHSAFSKMHPAISKINWIFFREDQDDFEQSLQGLLSVIHRHETYVHQHTTYLKAALTWDRYQQRSDYLLVGEALPQSLQWLKTNFLTEQPPCIPSDLHCRFISQSYLADRNQHSHIYLCYADEDQQLAMVLYWKLLHEGWLVWNRKLDLDSSGSLQDKTFRAIEAADNFIYFFSSHTQQSKGCQKELAHAFNLEKRIIPIQLDQGDTNKAVLEKLHLKPTNDSGRALNRIYNRLESKERNNTFEQLKNLHFIKLFKPGSSTLSEAGLKQLSQELSKDASFHEQQTDLLMRSLLWKGHRYNPRLLLQGYRLIQAQSWLQLAQEIKKGFYTVLQEDYIRVSSTTPPADEVEVFLLYAALDQGFATRINQSLQVQGRSTWFAGDYLNPETSDAFEQCQKMLLEAANCIAIVSPSLLQDPQAQSLLQDVMSLQKRFIPVVYRPLDPSLFAPSGEDLSTNLQEILPLFQQMEERDWIDFVHHNRDFHTGVGDLIRILDLDREYVRVHSQWGLRARQWLQSGQTEALLLQHHELTTAETWLDRALTEKRSPLVTAAQRSFIEASRQAQDQHRQRAEQERQRELNRARRLAIASTVAGVLMTGMALFSSLQLRKAELETVETLRISAELLFSEGKELQALIQATNAYQRRLRTSLLDVWIKNKNLSLKVQGTLQDILLNIHESNEWAAQVIQLSPSGQWLVIHQQDGTLQVWHPNGPKQLEWKTPRQEVGFLAISANDRLLATGGKSGEVSLWSLETGAILQTWSAHSEALTSLTFSPDSQSLLTAGGGTVYRWDWEGTEQAQFASPEAIVEAVFSPSGQQVLTLNENQQAELWTIAGDRLASLKTPAPISSFAFSPQGDFILTGHENGELLLWQIGALGQGQGSPLEQPLRRQTVSNQPIHSIAISPDFPRSAPPATGTESPAIVIATGSAGGVLRLWDRQLQLQRQIFAHTGAIQSLHFNQETTPPGQTPQTHNKDLKGIISLGEQDRMLRFWSLDGWQKFAFDLGASSIKTLNLSPDRTFLVTLSQGGQARSWSLEDHQRYTLYGTGEPINTVRYSPDGQFLVTLTTTGSLELWSINLEQGAPQKLRQWSQVQEVIFSPDSQQLLWLAKDPQKGQVIQMRSLRSSQLDYGRTLLTSESELNTLSHLQVSPQSDRIAVQSSTGQVYIWNLEGEQFLSFRPHQNPLQTLTFHPLNNSFVTTDVLGQIKYWQADGQPQWSKDFGNEEGNAEIYLTQFSPDGEWLITVQGTGVVQVWQSDRGEANAILNENLAENPVNGQVLSITFEKAPDQKRAESGFAPILLVERSDSSLSFQFWRDQGQQIQTTELNLNDDGTKEAYFVPNLPWVKTISWGGIARIWDLEGHKIVEIKNNHYGDVQSIAVSPDRRWFVTAGQDGTAKIWPIQSGAELITESCQWLQSYLSNFAQDDPQPEVCVKQRPVQ
ncbi:MAG: TIR domain-containing protein [Prochlorotrichaceae cyanobacterium]|jgi:WD40 repeat protein